VYHQCDRQTDGQMDRIMIALASSNDAS